MKTFSFCAFLGLVCHALGGELLYNGIQLPDVWPPQIKTLTREALAAPPYLNNPPSVIPIDVGRQMFVDDFLVAATTLTRKHHLPVYHPANPLISPDKTWEGEGGAARAAVFSDGVWFDAKDQLFKAWYYSGKISEKPLEYATCLATSRDGIHWEKPILDVVPGTNIVMRDTEGLRRDSNTVWLDQSDPDQSKRFKMFRVVSQDFADANGKTAHKNFILHHVSPDGIHWNLVGKSGSCGDRSTVFFNALRQRWVAGLRGNSPLVSRCREYFESADAAGLLKFPVTMKDSTAGVMEGTKTPVSSRLWVGADDLDPAREDLKLRRIPERPWDLVPSQLYNLDCIAYESLLLGTFSIWRGQTVDEIKRPKINEVCIGFSRDGFHWSRPERRAFCPVSEDTKAWNYGNVQGAAGVCLVVGDKLYFYVGGAASGRGMNPSSTGLALLRRDGFTSMEASAQEGTLTTRPVRFKGSRLFVNVDAPEGTFSAEILDEAGVPVPPFSHANCHFLPADTTKQEVTWEGAKDFSALSGKPLRFRFHLTNGAFYSFWVSQDEGGASNGFVAAGGPGYAGPVDSPKLSK